MFECDICGRKFSRKNGLTFHKRSTHLGIINIICPTKGKPGTFRNKKHSKGSKHKIAESMRGNYNAKHRGDRQSYYKGVRMDSSWEVGVAR